MSRDRYLELIGILKEGYKLNLKTFIITNPKGKELKLSKHGERAPVVTLKHKQYAITEVIGVWLGMDVIDNYCVMLDKNRQNFHPGNLLWTNKSTALALANSKLTPLQIKKIKKIDPSELSKLDGTKGKLAKKFGICKRHLYSIVHGQRWKKESFKINSSI